MNLNLLGSERSSSFDEEEELRLAGSSPTTERSPSSPPTDRGSAVTATDSPSAFIDGLRRRAASALDFFRNGFSSSPSSPLSGFTTPRRGEAEFRELAGQATENMRRSGAVSSEGQRYKTQAKAYKEAADAQRRLAQIPKRPENSALISLNEKLTDVAEQLATASEQAIPNSTQFLREKIGCLENALLSLERGCSNYSISSDAGDKFLEAANCALSAISPKNVDVTEIQRAENIRREAEIILGKAQGKI